ncbi:MAG: glutathione S-transferase family protein [Salinarimonas sp.]
MTDLVLATFDWVPEQPRGFVRDLRVRWALEEAGLPYRVERVPFRERSDTHLAHQPFGQVPWLVDGDLSIFESGAILLHLGARSEALLPADPRRRSEAVQWIVAALNSMETAIVPWLILTFAGDPGDSPGTRRLIAYRDGRLRSLEAVLRTREWLAGGFSAADILMADALRLVEDAEILETLPACRAYVARATARPAFRKAHADQLAHFAAADAPAAAS